MSGDFDLRFAMTIPNLLRFAGHMLALTWAGFWIAAGARAALLEAHSVADVLRFTFLPGGVFLLLVAIAWKWEHISAWAILLCGLILIGHSSRQPDATGPMLLLVGPPLIGGILLLFYERWKGREANHAPPRGAQC